MTVSKEIQEFEVWAAKELQGYVIKLQSKAATLGIGATGPGGSQVLCLNMVFDAGARMALAMHILPEEVLRAFRAIFDRRAAEVLAAAKAAPKPTTT